MADAALGVVMDTVLNRVVSLVAEEFTLVWGVHEELKKLAEKREMIQALLSDAQTKQFTSKAVQIWLQRLGFVALDAQVVLDEFGYQLLRQKMESRKRDKVRRLFTSSNPFVHRPKIAHKIKDVVSSLEQVYAESNRIGLREVINSPPPHSEEERKMFPVVNDSEIVGRDGDTSKVIHMLVGSDYERELPVITILGMGGQGKTTLAQLVYKNDKVNNYFDKTVWVCVSDNFNIERLLSEMLQSLTKTNHQLTTAEALVGTLKEQLSGKRYLLVLDDVWNENGEEWDRMRSCLQEIGGSKGSKVLATTRNEKAAETMHTSKYHWLQVLSEEQSWKLFEKWAFADGGPKKSPELVDIGKRILKRCGGLPLAIRLIGGLLYLSNSESEWSMIERRSDQLWIDLSEGSRVLAAIKLSYDHLPSLALKQCFAYCAIFQKDTRMEKDELIQLWMAQGLLNPPKGSPLQMEDIGTKYFNILLRSCLLGDVEKDDDDNIKYCKMHDLVHDLALWVIKDVHLSITASEEGLSKSEIAIVPSKKLRILHVKGSDKLVDLLAKFRYVTVLILDDGKMKELPNSIGKMKYLRFLDISCCYEISRLPKSVTKLYYLQTLRVRKLDEVPKGFWKLINLRHFYITDSWLEQPLIPRLGEMTNLRTLPYFKVDKCMGCQIEELEYLDNLKGQLWIYCLQNVSTRESALKSKLSKKSEILALGLDWELRREEGCDDSDVMEGLEPHPNLKILSIYCYHSPKFPSWIKLLHNLVKLNLMYLKKCEQLPSLGNLPCLEYLKMDGFDNVRCIGKEFYGWSNLESSSSSSSSSLQIITLFPSLKVFKLWGMINLVEWSDAIVPAAYTHSLSIQVFPVLEEMDIGGLLQLCSFPNLSCLPKLRRLRITSCDRLTNIPSDWKRLEKSESEDERAASDSCVVSSWEGPSSSSSSCPPPPPHLHHLPSLREVYLQNCGEFTGSFCSLKILAPIESLVIKCKPSFWPKDLHNLINLRSLELGGYIFDDYKEVECFPFFPYSISNPKEGQYFPSLTALKLNGTGLPNVTSLPHQIQYLISLTNLNIDSFDGLEALPEWLGNLKSLRNLSVYYCPKLKQLPSMEAFQRLTNLQCLTSTQCSKLEEACTKGSGSEWPKIAKLLF